MYNLKPNQCYAHREAVQRWNEWIDREENTLPQKTLLKIASSELTTVRDQIHTWLEHVQRKKKKPFEHSELHNLMYHVKRLHDNPLWFWTTNVKNMKTLTQHMECNFKQDFWFFDVSKDNLEHYAQVIAHILPDELRSIATHYSSVYDYNEIIDQDDSYEPVQVIDKSEYAQEIHEQLRFFADSLSVSNICIEHEHLGKEILLEEASLAINVPSREGTRRPFFERLALTTTELQDKLFLESTGDKDGHQQIQERVMMHGIYQITKNPELLNDLDFCKSFLAVYMKHMQKERQGDKAFHIQKNQSSELEIQGEERFHSNRKVPLNCNADEWCTQWNNTTLQTPIHQAIKTLLLIEFPEDTQEYKMLHASPILEDQNLQIQMELGVWNVAATHLAATIENLPSPLTIQQSAIDVPI